MDLDQINAENKTLFTEPKKDKTITRHASKGFNNLSTTDDHGMHIVGLAKDQSGKEYYMVKNLLGSNE
jgi:bleomycin hydrolase